MRSVSIVVAAVLGIGAAGSASADPVSGSRLGPDVDRQYHSKKSSEQQARVFVSCMVVSHTASARTLLNTTDKAAMEKASSALGDVERCDKLDENETASVGAFQYPIDIIRGMIAEIFLAPNLDQAAKLPNMPVERGYSRTWFALSGRDAAVDSMAVCLAENAPGGVAALLRTEAYTPSEMAAVQALGPNMGKCLQVGVKLKANRQALRAAIAEGLYHRLNGPVPAVAGK